MEYRCCVLGCLKTSSDAVRLHKFPFDNQSLLPIWIMATNRSDWLPNVKSRMCEHHFSIDEYENGDKNNKLKSNACPMFNTSNNDNTIGYDETMTDSDTNDISSASEEYFSPIDTCDLDVSPRTCDLKYSDDDWMQYDSSDYNSNEVTELDDVLEQVIPSLSDTEINVDKKGVELDCVSLSSPVTSLDNFSIHKCAVVLCNVNTRNQFEELFFINFPADNKKLCDTWWKICGRNDEFDFSFKICSIHFNIDDFLTVTVRREGKLFKQTILKNNNIVPTRYLLSHEYTKFTKKQKRCIKDKTEIENKSTEIEKCSVQYSNNTSAKDDKKTFSEFPLENKHVFQKLFNNIGSSNWQPLKTDQICSDHLKNDFIVDNSNDMELNKYAVPLITPKKSFRNNSEDQNVKYKNCAPDFSDLQFNSLNENGLIVREKRKKKTEDEENVLLPKSFKSSTKDQQQHKSLKTTMEIISIKEKQILNSPEKCNKTNLEHICMDILDNVNNIEELQFKQNNTKSLAKLYLESFVKEITEDESNKPELTLKKAESHFKGNSVNISNATADSHMTLAKCTPKVIEKSQNMFEENNLIPKSKNNGNDQDYVYLDTLNGDDVGEFLSFEKKCVSKHLKKKMPLLIEKSCVKETPESIIYNQDLTECYGEMLPPNCDQKCQYICYYSIPNHLRREIYKEFQLLHNVTEQNCFITELVQFSTTLKGDYSFESCPSYHLLMNNEPIKVCQTFFINTLGITEQRLNAILKPANYSWYSDKETALKANQPKQVKVINETTVMTDFMKESLLPLNKDYNSYEPESDSEVSLENVPIEEYEKVFLYMKGIPRVLSSYQMPGELKKQFFETSISLEYMYKTYSENYIRKKISPPYTKRQFKKIYNQYMKTFLKMV